MAIDDDILRLLASDLGDRGLIVLAGAGASFAPPACAPLFRPLRDGLLRGLIGSLHDKVDPAILERAGRLFSSDNDLRRGVEPVPEVLFEALHAILADRLFDILRILLALPAPNAHHRFVADLAGRGLRLLITTNFEDGFEQAFRERSRDVAVSADGPSIQRSLSNLTMRGSATSPVPIWKVHGTLDAGSEESIRVTLSQIARESLDTRKFEPVIDVAKELPLLVVGYSGYDRDLSQVLIRAGDEGRRLVWLSWREPEPDDPARRIVAAWGDRAHLAIGDLSELGSSLSALISGMPGYAPPSGVCGDRLEGRFAALDDRMGTIELDSRLACLATLCAQLADVETALAVLAVLEERAVQARSGSWLLFCLLMRTNVLRSSGQGQELGPTLQRLQQLRGAMGEVGDPSLFGFDAALLQEIGGYFKARGSFGQALDAYGKALAMAKLAREEETVAMVSQSLGAMLSHLGRGREAALLFDVALASAKTTGNRVAELKARHEIAILAIEQRHPADASALLTENVAAAREIGASDIEAADTFELGLLAIRAQRHDDAERLLTRARELSRLMGAKATELNAQLHLGDLEQEREQYESSIATLSECVAAAAASGHGTIQATALSRRARSYAMLAEIDSARADLAAARPLAERWHPRLLVEIDALTIALGR